LRLQSRDRLLDLLHDMASDSIDRNIDFHISRLRRKLGDSARNPRYIATQYGEGYVWVAEPGPGAVDGAAAEDSPRSRAEAIAVLPFRNMSAEPESDYFSEGISEEIINRLGTFGTLRVIARASSFSYKDRDVSTLTIGQQLGVDCLLTGSVRRDARGAHCSTTGARERRQPVVRRHLRPFAPGRAVCPGRYCPVRGPAHQ
tara:strand:+ start:542 stop:1144 length:603 start_codon:yes stop_codon:yes gene_type:complete